MRFSIRRNTLLAALLMASNLPAISQPVSAAVAERLKQGGAVIYFRHGDTKGSVSRMEGCEDERNLSDAGREEMRRIGSAIRRIGPSISEVLASPYCRTRETALIAFGTAQPTEVLYSVFGEPERDRQRTPEVLRLLSTPPTGAVRVMVAHGSNLSAALGIALDEGEAAIFTPPAQAGGQPRLLARVKPAEWSGLAAAR